MQTTMTPKELEEWYLSKIGQPEQNWHCPVCKIRWVAEAWHAAIISPNTGSWFRYRVRAPEGSTYYTIISALELKP